MTNPSATHVTDVDIDRFCRQEMSAIMMVAFTDHLADCGECRRRVEDRRDVAAGAASLREALDGDDDHVPEADIHAFVDGRLPIVRRGEISTHLDQCPACAEEVRDLQTFAAQLTRAQRLHSWWAYAGLAAAAALVLGVVIPRMSRTESPRQVATLNDANGVVTLDSRGSLAGVGTLEATDRERVRQALAGRGLSAPAALPELTGSRGALMGSTDTPAFHLIGPVGTRVLSDRPTLGWTPLAASATYIVTLQDHVTGETTSSRSEQLEWAPEHPLTRGRIYSWQVAASLGGREIVAPAPPEPPARFMIVEPAEAVRLEHLPASHLVRGVLYANAGLFDDAARELTALSMQNPDSDIANSLLTQIQELRGPRPQ
jgi:anti-sigma factor RsiW